MLYELPEAFRDGLGFGAGDVVLTVKEDGIPIEDPLAFSFETTNAFTVELVYDLQYRGDTAFGRESDVAFVVTLAARRTATGWTVEYTLAGDCFFGETYCELETNFRAPGSPSDGVESGFGDGFGFIDDPDVVDVYEMNLDFGDGRFRAQGEVGCCAYFDADIYYFEVF